MTKTLKPTTSRRAFLASAPAILAASSMPAHAAAMSSISPAGSIPARAASTGVTPELAKMIEKWETARAEHLRLEAIDDAADDLYYRTAPEIPERIVASKLTYIYRVVGGDDYLRKDFPEEQKDHLRHVHRAGTGTDILKSSWWWLKLSQPHNLQRTAEWTENIHIADQFEAADDAARAAAGVGAVNPEYDRAVDLVNELDREIEEFDAQSFADIAAIARVSKVIAEEQEIFQESWDDLISNILAVAEREGV